MKEVLQQIIKKLILEALTFYLQKNKVDSSFERIDGTGTIVKKKAGSFFSAHELEGKKLNIEWKRIHEWPPIETGNQLAVGSPREDSKVNEDDEQLEHTFTFVLKETETVKSFYEESHSITVTKKIGLSVSLPEIKMPLGAVNAPVSLTAENESKQQSNQSSSESNTIQREYPTKKDTSRIPAHTKRTCTMQEVRKEYTFDRKSQLIFSGEIIFQLKKAAKIPENSSRKNEGAHKKWSVDVATIIEEFRNTDLYKNIDFSPFTGFTTEVEQNYRSKKEIKIIYIENIVKYDRHGTRVSSKDEPYPLESPDIHPAQNNDLDSIEGSSYIMPIGVDSFCKIREKKS